MLTCFQHLLPTKPAKRRKAAFSEERAAEMRGTQVCLLNVGFVTADREVAEVRSRAVAFQSHLDHQPAAYLGDMYPFLRMILQWCLLTSGAQSGRTGRSSVTRLALCRSYREACRQRKVLRRLRVGCERFRPPTPFDCHAALYSRASMSRTTLVDTSATCSDVLRVILLDVGQEKKKWSPLDRMTRS